MPIIVGRHAVVGDIPGEIARLEGLITDLERVGMREFPTAAELDAAPFLDRFVIATRPVTCLVGYCEGHPLVTGRLIQTSDVWVLASELGWARTLSRTYKLGSQLHKGGV